MVHFCAPVARLACDELLRGSSLIQLVSCVSALAGYPRCGGIRRSVTLAGHPVTSVTREASGLGQSRI